METGTDETKTCSFCRGPIGYEIKDAHAGFASLPPGKRYRVFHCMNRHCLVSVRVRVHDRALPTGGTVRADRLGMSDGRRPEGTQDGKGSESEGGNGAAGVDHSVSPEGGRIVLR
ncbi:MAG: hypothetical protein EOP26_09090 [Rhodococcus sp. (in: high G+C Gram-positive bacteria)]|nr:MAG: hypothetical protein EOP26_09090 [Rhodococcus sp. (in: high G+C Gram-positive bacteria)]